jgi:hypothetical protein
MMITTILLALGLALLGYGVLRARRIGGKDRVRSPETWLRIAMPPRRDLPVLTLEYKGAVQFGPVQARWTAQPEVALACGNPGSDAALPGGQVPGGRYRVLDVADLSEAAEPIRRAFGTVALILRPEAGGRDVLLHGTRRQTQHSAGGVAILNRALDALVEQLGDPRGLRVEIERRSIRRQGWGGTGRRLAGR